MKLATFASVFVGAIPTHVGMPTQLLDPVAQLTRQRLHFPAVELTQVGFTPISLITRFVYRCS